MKMKAAKKEKLSERTTMKSDHSEQCKKFGSLGDIYDDCNCSPDGYKLVPADAIVLTGITKEDLFNALSLGDLAPKWKEILELLDLEPQLAEPTGFGAIVKSKLRSKWGINMYPVVEEDHYWVRDIGGSWRLLNVPQNFAVCWDVFINPTLISEGMVKK